MTARYYDPRRFSRRVDVRCSCSTASPEASAARNTEAEQYVQSSASGALHALNDRTLASTARRQTFHSLMSQFADMPRIANYVLGRYGSALRADAQLRTDWNRTFQEYSIAVYEDRLDAYSTSSSASPVRSNACRGAT